MAGVAGRSGTNKGKNKPFRDALAMEAALAEKGEETPAHKGSLRWIARKLLERAADETAAAREVGDRLDGKPAQAIIGDSDEDPVNVLHKIERVIVDSPNTDSEDIPAAT